MKACGIEIKSNKAIFVILEKDKAENITDITRNFKSLTIEDDTDHSQILDFIDAAFSHFQSIGPDKIGIIKRSTKGQFASSPISFKLEGLIQSYKTTATELVSPHTLRAFYKKQALPIAPTHIYQKAALELAFYLLK